MSEVSESGKTKILLVIIAVLLIILVGGGMYLFLNQRASAQQPALKPEIGPTASLGEFTVNLADNKSFVRATIVLEIDNKKVEKELAKRDAQIKHSVISTLRLTKPEQIADVNGIEILCSKVKQNINKLLSSGSVENVYFTQLVVQ